MSKIRETQSESVRNKIVFITGASSGIGKACAEQFASVGARLILTARRLDRLEALSSELIIKYGVEVLPLSLEVQNKKQVMDTIRALPANLSDIDILINNAGKALSISKIQDGDPSDWDEMINTNVNGLLYVTHAVLPGMIQRNSGYIINIGSTAGHECYPGGNVYCATKHAVKAISKSLRLDLLGTAIRVSEIDPGMVLTEFSEVRFKGDIDRAGAVYRGLTPLAADDIAETVLFCATRPPHVNIAEIVIYPTDQASPSHVHRRNKDVGK